VRVGIDIQRPVDEVFAYVADLTHDPEWFRGVREVRVVSAAHPGAGSEYEQVTVLFGRPFTARVRMLEYEPPRRASLCSLESATPFRATYSFEPLASGGGTRYTLDAEVSGTGLYRLLGPLFLPMLRQATQRRLVALKHLLEMRRPPLR
jgi:uncharacterized protein YndB with AHSA1/START domain